MKKKGPESLTTVRAHRDALFTEAEKGRRRVLELEAEVLKTRRRLHTLSDFIVALLNSP